MGRYKLRNNVSNEKLIFHFFKLFFLFFTTVFEVCEIYEFVRPARGPGDKREQKE